MDHREAFRRAIVDDPDDIESRLIFADWLEEHGDPRGQFIRAQVQLAETDEADLDSRADLENLIENLLARHSQDWIDEDLGRKYKSLFTEFNLGFVDAISLSANRLISAGEEIFQRAPVRCVRLYEARHAIGQLAACPLLRQIRGISFRAMGNSFGSTGLASLLASPHLTKLRWLDLREADIGVDALLPITRWPRAEHLESLTLSGNRLGGGGMQFLSEADSLTGLRRLDLTDCGLGDADIATLAASGVLDSVTALYLARNDFGLEGAAALGC